MRAFCALADQLERGPKTRFQIGAFLTMKKVKCSVCGGDGLSREPVGFDVNAWNFRRSAMNPGASKPCGKCQGSGDGQTCHGSGDVYSY